MRKLGKEEIALPGEKDEKCSTIGETIGTRVFLEQGHSFQQHD